MQKKFKLLIGVIAILFTLSNCKKNVTNHLMDDNVFLNSVILYTQNELQKVSISNEKIKMNLGSFDFENFHVINDNIVIVNIKENGLKKSLNENKKVIYYIKKGIIVGGSIVTFKSNHSIEYIESKMGDIISVKLLEFVFNNKKVKIHDISKEFSFRGSSFSGEVILTGLNNRFQLSLELEDGKLLTSKSRQGIIVTKSSSLKDSPAGLDPGECIDWYLVTTYHYADGTTRTTEWYLYTECYGDESIGGGCSSSTSNFFDQVEDKININSPDLFKEIVCLIKNLRTMEGPPIVTDMISGWADNFGGSNMTQRTINYDNHNVTITVVYDNLNPANQIMIDPVTHLGQLVYYDIRVMAGMDNSGATPNLLILRFAPEDGQFVQSIWDHISGRTSLWPC